MKKGKGITKHGKKINVFSERLCDKIRKRLKLTEEQLPNKLIRATIKFLNFQLGEFILENREGIQLSLSENKPNGVLAISKHLPKEMREDKFNKIDKINGLDIPESLKKIYLKRYDTNVRRRLKMNTLEEVNKEYHVNPHSFFYAYKVMWFNHRNCYIKKATAYTFQATSPLRQRLLNVIMNGKDFDELHFHNFYKKKLQVIL